MSLIDKISRPAGGLDPLLDSSLPAWKKDLILKKRAMHRTFPFHLSSVAECGRSKHLASGVGDERSSVPAASLHASRNSAEGSGAFRKPQALGRELNNTGDGGDATHAFQNSRDMTEERVNANNIDGGISRLELSGRSESTSPSLHGGSQQSLVYDPESASDNEEEYEYGPGIVNRLRSKFISLTRRDGNRGPTTPPPPPQPSFVPVRRVASMEHLLDEPFSSSSRPMRSLRRATPSSSSRSLAIPHSTTEVLKRARSMETLSAVDRGPSSSHSFVPRFMYRGFSREDGPPLSPVNDNVIIIEQSKPSQSNPNHISGVRLAQDGRKGTLLMLLDEDEFPKPDTVRTCKKIFEHSTGDSESNGVPPAPNTVPSKRKVAPPPKPPGLKPGPKPLFARRISSPGATKPVFKLLEQNEKLGDERPTPPVEVTTGEGLENSSSGVASILTNGVADAVTEIPEYVPDSFEPNGNKLSDQVGTFDSCAKRNDFHEDAIVNLVREPSPVPDLVTVTAEDEEPPAEGNGKPKVVSFQPKPDDKDRPVGHIRPFQPAEQNSAVGAVVQDETYSIPNGGDASPTYAFPPKKPIPPPNQGLVSQVFNFIGKQVQAHIPNNAAPFESRRRPTRQADRVNSANVENLTPHSNGSGSGYYIVGDGGTTDDYSDEEDGIDSSTDLVSGLGVSFVGDNIIVGRSALMKTRNKKLKIVFDDQALSTYEYPSENSLLDHESQGVASLGMDRDASTYAPSSKSQDTLKSTPGIGSSSGLGSYKPMAVGSAHVFKLGEMPAPNAPASNRANQNTTKEEVDEEDLFLKPAPDDQNQVWSSAETSDILF